MALLVGIIPFIVIFVVFISRFFLKSEFTRSSYILAVSLSSWALIFGYIRPLGIFYGGADIGFGMIMLFSPLLSVPMGLVGLFIGKDFGLKKSIFISFVSILIWVGLSLAWNRMILNEKEESERKSKLNCEKMAYHCAIKEDRLDELPRLKENGFDTESKDGWGRTALIANLGQKKVVEALLKIGADPNATDAHGYTALYIVLLRRTQPSLETAQLLIDFGANVNQMHSKGSSPLRGAVAGKKNAITEFLLNNGADPKLTNSEGVSVCDIVRTNPQLGIGIINQKCHLEDRPIDSDSTYTRVTH
jgi:hypothetical protein